MTGRLPRTAKADGREGPAVASAGTGNGVTALYTVEYEPRVGSYRWRIAPGYSLLNGPPPSAGRPPRVAALGDGSEPSVVLRGPCGALASAESAGRGHDEPPSTPQ